MFYGVNLIERFWRGLFEARLEGIFGGLNVLSSFCTQPACLPNRTCREPRGARNGRAPVERTVVPGPAAPCYSWEAPVFLCATLSEDLAALPLMVVRRFWETFSDPAAPVIGRSTAVAREQASPAALIVAEADAFLSRVPGEGALLADLVENVVLKTGYDEKTVRAAILRSFQSNGRLVWRGMVGDGTTTGGTIGQMKRALQLLGYDDLRENVSLTAVPERMDRAALLAYDAFDPAVLCYPVNPGEVEDPMIREAALFQAGAVAADKTAHYVWVGDGVDDFFFDFRGAMVIAQLPARKSPTVVVGS